MEAVSQVGTWTAGARSSRRSSGSATSGLAGSALGPAVVASADAEDLYEGDVGGDQLEVGVAGGEPVGVGCPEVDDVEAVGRRVGGWGNVILVVVGIAVMDLVGESEGQARTAPLLAAVGGLPG